MSMASQPKDAYAVLGVDPAAEDEHIAAAYRVLARRYHPDIAGESATRRMMRIERRLGPTSRPGATGGLRPRTRRDRPAPGGRGPLATGQPPAIHAAARPRRARYPPRRPPGRATHAPHYEAPYQGYARQAERDGTGAAGRPPGRPSGSVLKFGRHIGWSLGEIARVDPGYLVWLEERPEGRPYAAEIDAMLRRSGFRSGSEPTPKKGRFGR